MAHRFRRLSHLFDFGDYVLRNATKKRKKKYSERINVFFLSFAVPFGGLPTHSTQASFDLFHFVAGGAFDPETGVYSVPGGGGGGGDAAAADEWGASGEEIAAPYEEEFPRHYVVADFMSHPNLSSLPHDAFFNACRLEDVCYDMEGRSGTVFSLVDSFASNVLGVLCVGATPGESFRELAAGLDFIARQIGPGIDTSRPPGAPHRGDEEEEEAEVGTPFRLVHSTVKFLAAQLGGGLEGT